MTKYLKRSILIPAFSLIEASLALLLLGVFMSVIFTLDNTINHKHRIILTRIKAYYVMKAVTSYVAIHGMLPQAASLDGTAQENKYCGEVPFKTLGIPRYYAYDGFGKKFVYIVSAALTKDKNKLVVPIFFPLNIAPILLNQKEGMAPYSHFCRLRRHDFWQNIDYTKDCSEVNKNIDELNKEWIIQVQRDGKKIEGKKIEFPEFPICHIYKFFFNYSIYMDVTFAFERWERSWKLESVLDKNKEPYQDCIAFLLISSNGGEKYEIIYHDGLKKAASTNPTIAGKGTLFYQSRFNIAALSNNPATVESIDYNMDYNMDYIDEKKDKKNV